MSFLGFESSEKLLHALSITQISKNDSTDFHDFWTFSEIPIQFCKRMFKFVPDFNLPFVYFYRHFSGIY